MITGAAGRIGSVLRGGVRDLADELRLVDIQPIEREDEREQVLRADLTDFDTALESLSGADAVIHLAAIPAEDSFERLLHTNFAATYNVFEAARRQGVSRAVFASSNHATGMYPILLAPDVGFTIAYGTSANSRSWWDDSSARRLGYEPRDDAERFISGFADESQPGDEFQGGRFADPRY